MAAQLLHSFPQQGKNLPKSEQLKNMASWVFGDPSRHCLTYTLTAKGKKPALNIHYIARHTDVIDILRGPYKDHISVAHYDDLIRSATPELEFVLGAPTPHKDERWDILRKAFDHPPKLRRTETAVFDAIAQRAVDKVLETILHITGTNETFNAVRDYSYLVPFLVAAELTGLAVPERPTVLLRAVMALRNKGKNNKVILKGLSAQSEQLLLWSQMVFGHAFTNIGDRVAPLRWGDQYASRQFIKAIRTSMRETHTPPAGSLIARFQAVRHQFPDIKDDDYEQHIINTVYEIAGTVVILAGTSFANILSTLQTQNVSVADYLQRVKIHGEIVIDEAMRLTPTTGQLYRRVKTDFEFHGTPFKSGDMICMLLAETMRDAEAFPEPDVLSDFSEGSPKRNFEDYLNFGPNEVIRNPFNPQDDSHPCFGQYWARDMLTKMLEGLTRLPDFKLTAPLETFLTMPDAMPATFDMPAHIKAAQNRGAEPSQHLYTFCTEICGTKTDPAGNDAAVILEIEKLGTPAKPNPDIQAKILATNCIHFMSLSVISGASASEPSYLVLEMGADGDEDDVINTLYTYFGEELYHIYALAGCIKTREDIVGHLQDHGIELAQSSWPEFFSGKRRNGLGFSGTAGLASDRIRAEDRLAEFAIDTISDIGAEGEGTAIKSPQQILQDVRSALAAPDLETTHPEVAKARWALENSEAPNFAEKADSEWKLGGGIVSAVVKMFPRNFIAYFALLYLAVTALVSVVMFGGRTRREALCEDTVGCVSSSNETTTNLLSNPIGLETIPSGPGTLFIYNSPLNIALGIFAAFMFSILASNVATWIRKGIDNFYSMGFARMGAVFWFILAFVLYVGYQSAYPYLSEGLQIEGANARGFQFFRIGQGPWIWALVFTLVFCMWAVTAKRVRPERSLSAVLTTFLMAITILAIGIGQLRLMGVIEGPVTDFAVINRWAGAGLQHLIFYPLLLSLILTAAVYAFSLSFPKFKLFMRKGVMTGVFIATFAFVFVTTFFGWDEISTSGTNALSNIVEWCIAPLACALIAMTAYLAFNRYIVGKRFGTKTFLKSTIVLAIILSLGAHFKTWATSRLGETIVAFILAIPVALFFAALFAALLFVLIRASEIRNKPHDTETQTDNLDDIMSRENNVVAQNHMISVVRLVPEQFRRRFTLPLALNIILEGLKNNSYRPGFLGSIGTVHYARWVHLPKTNNYVFYSNYDGSFENYLEDFITKASFGLTGAWSHSVGFPETNLLFLKGSQDGDRFKRYARGSMIPTPFWFSAYPNISAEQIRRNALIRDGIARIDSPSDAEAWLDLFGSRTRPANVIQTERIQTLMFSGAGKLKVGACLVVRSHEPAEESAAFKAWVRDVTPTLTFGETSPTHRASYIAFAKDGLIRLGLETDLRQETEWTGAEELLKDTPRTKFPPVMSLGMDSETRKNILGDGGVDAPEHWDWGSSENPAHAVLLVYAVDDEDLRSLISEQMDRLEQHGLSATHVEFEPLISKQLAKEPFGFVDGVSQPIMRGTQRAAAHEGSHHLVNPGEFILGYEDNRNYYPPSPQIEAVRDGANDLPATVQHHPQLYPRFEPTGTNTLRDLGRNGSYLVIRQLEQDVDDFHAVTGKIAESLCPVTGSKSEHKKRVKKAKDVIQAKMMGRWQDGRSLMENPVRIHRQAGGQFEFEYKDTLKPTWTPENEFLFGEDDPQGHACPYGSHIRRANPRDGLEPDSADALSIVNRHRLLRRGRSYIQGNKRGTFFMCLNADIDRQFEFVQQTWVASSKFHGLRKEVDPITAQGIHKDLAGDKTTDIVKDNLEFTIQAPGQEIPIKGLKSFVTMKGGGYFFMPGRDALRFLSR